MTSYDDPSKFLSKMGKQPYSELFWVTTVTTMTTLHPTWEVDKPRVVSPRFLGLAHNVCVCIYIYSAPPIYKLVIL